MKETIETIKKYLISVKSAVEAGNYRVTYSVENIALGDKFLLSEAKEKEIIMNLEATDFSEIKVSDDPNFAGHLLYVFGKDEFLIRVDDFERESVCLYIKFDKISDKYVVVVSLHEAENEIVYAFK